MRVVVTGTSGQVALSLRERAAAQGIDVALVGRPALDFENLETIGPALRAARPDLVVNAAAFTAVDLAENDEARATRVNGDAAGEVAAQAARLGAPIIHLSTDYVFDGRLDRPYREADAVAPMGAYGRSKLAGEIAVATATGNHVILRTAWIYSPFGKNFVRTMLALGCNRQAVSVVADQIGNPSYAPDIADGILAIADSLAEAPKDASLRGIFHLAGARSGPCRAHHERGLSDAGAPPGQFKTRLRQAASALRRRASLLASIGEALRGSTASGRGKGMTR